MQHLTDDRIGRALDRLFDADRAALLTEVVVAMGRRFGVGFAQLHNDSTSIAFCGQYAHASGRRLRARRAPAITYGYSKDHRPDLKQLLFILTLDADGGVPVQFRCLDGNTSDSQTHIETWNTLRTVAARPDFLYVADSKLCARRFHTPAGASEARAGTTYHGADGSVQHSGGLAASGRRGSVTSSGGHTVGADGNVTQSRNTTLTNSATGNAYQGSTSYDQTNGVTHSATCYDAAGSEIDCPSR